MYLPVFDSLECNEEEGWAEGSVNGIAFLITSDGELEEGPQEWAEWEACGYHNPTSSDTSHAMELIRVALELSKNDEWLAAYEKMSADRSAWSALYRLRDEWASPSPEEQTLWENSKRSDQTLKATIPVELTERAMLPAREFAAQYEDAWEFERQAEDLWPECTCHKYAIDLSSRYVGASTWATDIVWDIVNEAKNDLDRADYETSMQCLALIDSGYYEECRCGYNGLHDLDAEEHFYETGDEW